MERTCVVVATSDESALMRLRAAQTATAVAEHFRDQGADVLLMMDSITRFCHAQRQVGLAAGEPPATKGYPPSVFAMLPSLLERSGRTHRGSITGLYTVLTEGDDMSDPVAEACRGVLDGHILLSPKLAAKSHWPAIDVLRSISRCADDVITQEQRAARQDVLRLVNAHEEVEDLINIGAYAPGSNVETDLAIACKPSIDQFLQQSRDEKVPVDAQQVAMKQLRALGQQISTARLQLSRNQQGQRVAAAGPGR